MEEKRKDGVRERKEGSDRQTEAEGEMGCQW